MADFPRLMAIQPDLPHPDAQPFVFSYGEGALPAVAQALTVHLGRLPSDLRINIEGMRFTAGELFGIVRAARAPLAAATGSVATDPSTSPPQQASATRMDGHSHCNAWLRRQGNARQAACAICHHGPCLAEGL